MQPAPIRTAGLTLLFAAAVSFATACALTCVTSHCEPAAQAASLPENHHDSHSSEPVPPAEPEHSNHDCGNTCPGVFLAAKTATPRLALVTTPAAAALALEFQLQSELSRAVEVAARDHAPPEASPPLSVTILRI